MPGLQYTAHDAEGVLLGRNGALTIATFSGIGMEDIYVVDVQALGGPRVFARSLLSTCRAFEQCWRILRSQRSRSIVEDPPVLRGYDSDSDGGWGYDGYDDSD